MSSATASSSNSVLYFLAILVIIIVFRMRRIIQGTRVSLARTIGYSAYYVVFAGAVLASSFFVGIPVEYFFVYPILFLASLYFSFNFAQKRLVFWKLPDGSVYSKGGLAVYVIYIVGLVARIAIGYIYIGPNFFSFTPTPSQSPLGETGVAATVITDLLLVFGAGLLFGRNMRILKKYSAFKSGKETIPDIEGNRDDSGDSSSLPPSRSMPS